MKSLIKRIETKYGAKVLMSMRHRCLGIHSIGAEEKVVTKNTLILGRVIWQGGKWHAFPEGDARVEKGYIDSISAIFGYWGHEAC